MVNDNLTLTGALVISKNDVVVQRTKNLVVTAGKNWVADRMNDANTVMTHMALGTGTNAAAVGDTTLQTEIDRNALTSTTVSTNTIAYGCTWAAGDGTGAITEAGLFDAASGGDMLARTVFSVVNKGASDSITITWTITIS
tara:strand:- start:38115 stop:38537 length:423 start_codon:yes stop_codon:yes gene_type:complete